MILRVQQAVLYSQNKSKTCFTSEILGTPSLLHTNMIFTKINVYWCPSCKLNGVTYARYWLLESALYIGLLSNLFNIAPSWGWGGRGWRWCIHQGARIFISPLSCHRTRAGTGDTGRTSHACAVLDTRGRTWSVQSCWYLAILAS